VDADTFQYYNQLAIGGPAGAQQGECLDLPGNGRANSTALKLTTRMLADDRYHHAIY
jgi:hypothetical protein